MEHKEKINYMRMASNLTGFGFPEKELDMLVSLYDLILEKKGETSLEDIAKVQVEIEERNQIEVKQEEKAEA